MSRPELRLVTPPVNEAELKTFPVPTEKDEAFLSVEYTVDFTEAVQSHYQAGAYELAREQMWECPDPLFAAQVALDVAEEFGDRRFLEIARELAPDDQMVFIQSRWIRADLATAKSAGHLSLVQ